MTRLPRRLRNMSRLALALWASVALSGCPADRQQTEAWKARPAQVECRNLIADLGHPGEPDYAVRYFSKSDDAGKEMSQAPELAKRIMVVATVRACTDPTAAETLFRTVICLTPPDNALVSAAERQIRLLHIDGGVDTEMPTSGQ